MPRGTAIPITPEVLEWAIHESGHEAGAVAAAAGVDRRTVNAWLAGQGKPNLTQFHHLAAFLKRPEAVFFLPRPPQGHPVEVELRSPPGVKRREPSPDERLHIREAARLQRGLAWVMEELGEDTDPLPKIATARSPEEAAATVRSELGIAVAEQLGWGSEFEAQRRWRTALERRGVSVLFLPMGEDAVRGFSLWHPRAPVIAVNTHFNPQARSFTMLHEYAHLLTRTNSMCAQAPAKAWKEGDQIERWCEQFAAAFLVPWATAESLLAQKFSWKRGAQIDGLGPASHIAKKLHVSLRAAVLRLIDRNVAAWALYQQIPPLADQKSGGGAAAGGRRRPQIRVDEYGVRSTRAFLDAVRRDVITRDDALRYLDVADTEVEELEALTSAA